jgi:NADH-quinone oxidoreductase subunit L
MTVPLMLLCLCAIGSGWVGIPNLLGEVVGIEHSNWFTEFMNPVLGHPDAHGSHAEEWLLMGISVIAGLSGIGLSVLFYLVKPEIPVRLARQLSPIYKVLWNKYYVDELYSFTIVRPTLWLSKNVLMNITDAKIIEAIVNGVPQTIGGISQLMRKIQTGFLQHYAAIMATGVLILVALMLLR